MEVRLTFTKIIVLLGFGIPGLLILLIAGILARSRSAIVVYGIIASLLMGFQCLALLAMMSAGKAWSGDAGSDIPGFLFLGFLVAISVYFAIGLWRTKNDGDDVT